MPPKGNTSNAAYQKLKKDIREDRIGRLYVFHGEEAYLRDFYLGEMKKKLLPAGMEAFNLHTLSGREFDAKSLEQMVDCLPMMGERTLVVVYDYDIYKGDKDGLLTLLGDFSKGILSVVLGKMFFTYIGKVPAEYVMVGAYLAGFCAILGHLFPLYFGFRGGKGILTSAAGVVLKTPLTPWQGSSL